MCGADILKYAGGPGNGRCIKRNSEFPGVRILQINVGGRLT